MRWPWVSLVRYQSAIHQAAVATTAVEQAKAAAHTLREQLGEARAQLRSAEADAGQWRAEAGRLQQRVESLMDNILWANGQRPIFDPDNARFRPKTPEEVQVPERLQAKVESPAEKRRREEWADMEAAERNRKAELRQQLAAMTSQAKEKPDGNTNEA